MHEKATGIITYTASGVAMIGGLTLNDWAAIIGATVAVLSFLANLVYKHRHYQLARAKARAAGEPDPDPEAET